MKTKSNLLPVIAILLLAALLVLISCSDMMERMGSISLTITLDTPDVEVAYYTLEGALANTRTVFTLNNVSPPTHTLSSLKKGTWDLTLTAFNDLGQQIGIGTGTVNLKEGQIVEETLLVVFSQSAPRLSDLIVTAPARFDAVQSSITGTTKNMEYRLASASEETPYTPCSPSATLLAPGTYKIRYAEARGLEASEDLIVSVPAYQRIQLTVSAPTLTSPDKPYDGTSALSGSVVAGTLDNLPSGHAVNVHATATYSDKHAGTGKQITVSYTIDGDHAQYYLPPVDDRSCTGSITRKALSVSDTELQLTREYDGTNTARVTKAGTLTGIVDGDVVSLQATATYTDPDAGTGKQGTVTYTINGYDAENYEAPPVSPFTTGEITRRLLTATTGNYSKTYGEENPAFRVSVTGFANGESASTATGYTAPTASSAATSSTGAGSAPVTISGGSADNYTFDINDTGTLTINKAVLTATVGDYSKTYGEENPAFSVTVTGFVNGESASMATGYTEPTASSAATTSTDAGTSPVTIPNSRNFVTRR